MISMALQDEIVKPIKAPGDVHKVILFGSHARGAPGEESDIDIIVVLSKHGFSSSYAERMANRASISNRLIALRRRIPMDLLVYTIDEWNALTEMKSDFSRNVAEEGIVLA